MINYNNISPEMDHMKKAITPEESKNLIDVLNYCGSMQEKLALLVNYLIQKGLIGDFCNYMESCMNPDMQGSWNPEEGYRVAEASADRLMMDQLCAEEGVSRLD